KSTASALQALRSSEVEKRREAVEALAALGPDNAEAVSGLITALKDKDSAVQRAAGKTLVQFGQRTIPALIQALKNDNKPLRFQAARLLSQFEPPSEAGVAVLVEALKDKTQKLEAADALARIGPPAVPALVIALKDRSPAVRRDAAKILRDLGPKAKSATE